MSREGSTASSPIEARSRDAGYQEGDRRSLGSASCCFSGCAVRRARHVDVSLGFYAIDSEDSERTRFGVIEFARLQRLDGLLERIEETMAVDRDFGR
jgi:hypothetical protein